uniref:Putative secreted protein n=1 Tax=Ixodes scapularis TaxID=6945 RepID=A0A4D5RZI1_IXOSC
MCSRFCMFLCVFLCNRDINEAVPFTIYSRSLILFTTGDAVATMADPRKTLERLNPPITLISDRHQGMVFRSKHFGNRLRTVLTSSGWRTLTCEEV